MLSNIIDRVLFVLLGLAVLLALAAGGYARYELQKNKTLAVTLQSAQHDKAQAEADRNTALEAAAAAASAVVATQKAMDAQSAGRDTAKTTEAHTRAALTTLAKTPAVANALAVQIPQSVWDAIYKGNGG